MKRNNRCGWRLGCLTVSLLGAAGPLAAQEVDFDLAVRAASPFPDQPDQGRAVAWDAGGGAIVYGGHFGAHSLACATTRRGFVAKYTRGGDELWRRVDEAGGGLFDGWNRFDPAHVFASEVYGVAVEAGSGDVLVVGEVQLAWMSTDGFNAERRTATGAFVLRFASDGTQLNEAYFGTLPAGPLPLAEPVFTGCSEVGSPKFEQRSARAVALAPAGDVVITGWWRPAFASGRDAFVWRLSPGLVVQAASELATPADDAALGVAVAATGDVYVTGYQGAAHDVFVARWPAGGLADAPLEVRVRAGGAGLDEGRGVAVDAGGRVLVAGVWSERAEFGSEVLAHVGGGREVFVAAYDAGLAPLWLRDAGGVGEHEAGGIAVDALGNAYVTGWFHGTEIEFREGGVDPVLKLGAESTADVFVSRYGPDGRLVWAMGAGGPAPTDEATAQAIAAAPFANDVAITGLLASDRFVDAYVAGISEILLGGARRGAVFDRAYEGGDLNLEELPVE